jgi:prepilin-type N-terminal cleavage/methylation domain-containing protein
MNHQRGTTLIELLIAMSLLALIAVYGMSAARFLRNFDRVEQRIARQDLIDAVAGHIRAAIANARAVPLDGPADRPQLAFRGEPHDVAFVTAADPRLEYGGLSFVSFRLDRHSSLVALRRIFRASLTFDTSSSDPLLLAEGITQFDLAYYGPESEGETPRWHDAWPDPARLPRAVRLSLSSAGGSQPQVMTISIATAQ